MSQSTTRKQRTVKRQDQNKSQEEKKSEEDDEIVPKEAKDSKHNSDVEEAKEVRAIYFS